MTKLHSKITKTQTKIEIKTEIQIINKCCNSTELIHWYRQPLVTVHFHYMQESIFNKKKKKKNVFPIQVLFKTW